MIKVKMKKYTPIIGVLLILVTEQPINEVGTIMSSNTLLVAVKERIIVGLYK